MSATLLIVLTALLSALSANALRQQHPVNSGWGPAGVKQASGYVTVDGSYKNGSHLFYWLFESQNNATTDPLLIWLTGGPGCASELAMLFENGPLQLDAFGSPQRNPYAWNKRANLLYIDNPVGTGFSYADYSRDYVTNEKEVGRQLWSFLQEFMTMFPQYKNLEVSFFCESYGGHYCPAIGHTIVENNKNRPLHPINLKNLGIGNGWVDPYHQYPGYYQFAKKKGFIGVGEELALEAADVACQGLVATGVWEAAMVACNLYLSTVMEAISVHQGFQINPYNVNVPCAVEPLCYNFTSITNLLNSPSVQRSLGVKRQWETCNMEVHGYLMGDWMTNLATDLPAVLANGVRVLVYSGMDDFVCNYVGGMDWAKQLEWPGKAAYNSAPETPWKVNGKVAGFSKTAQVQGQEMIFLGVQNAGHMVPHDQPAAALQMVETMLQHKQFN